MKSLFNFLFILISLLLIFHFVKIMDLKKILNYLWSQNYLDTTENSQLSREIKARKIDTFFASFRAPVMGWGMEFVRASEKYGIDWRLLPSICRMESCGGKFPYNGDPQNILGYKIKRNIKSIEEAIDLSAKSISGNGRVTSSLYRGKDLRGRLAVYSGREVGYADKIFFFMKEIHSD